MNPAILPLLLAQIAAPVPGRIPMGLPPIAARPGATDGITVSGNATVQAQAAHAIVTLHVMSRNNAMAITAASLQPVADALVRAGVERSSITMPLYLQGNARTNNAEVSGTVERPTQAMLQNGIAQLAGAFASMPDLILNAADIRLTADGCEQLEQKAEAAALHQARANADYIAKQLNVRVGAVQAVQASGFAPDLSQSCVTQYGIGPFGAPYPMQSAQDYLTVRVFSSVSVRYAIRP